MINELKNELVEQQTKSNIATSQKQREIEELKNSLKNIKNQQKSSRKDLEEQVLKTQEELHKQEVCLESCVLTLQGSFTTNRTTTTF